ncbi:MAG TPA: FGGY family carbohydrate kinase, partial [Clostridia bacterium]|nr:FGGY family carbohydrate kinase [Clostridia bacterium]
MPYLLGCDFGGSSAKATLLSAAGQVVATASAEYPTHYPKPGWAEQDPEDSYRALIQNVHALLRESGVDPSEILALILDGATHTAVLLDDRDAVIRRAIYWTDKRSAPQAAGLKPMEAEILRLSYNAPSSLWTLPQLMWLKENEPKAHARIRRVLSMKDYVRFRLTGDYVTDSIEAMGFMLRDETAGEWSETLCGLAGLRPERMPEVVEPAARLSPLTAKACAETGLSQKAMVLAGATDTALEVFAAGAIAPGQATVKLATAGRICPITAQAVADRMLVCYRHVVPGLWYPGTATKSCATSNRWYRDTFGGEYEALSAAAATVPAGCEGLFYHPYLQGEITPYLDDRLRASFTG